MWQQYAPILLYSFEKRLDFYQRTKKKLKNPRINSIIKDRRSDELYHGIDYLRTFGWDFISCINHKLITGSLFHVGFLLIKLYNFRELTRPTDSHYSPCIASYDIRTVITNLSITLQFQMKNCLYDFWIAIWLSLLI